MDEKTENKNSDFMPHLPMERCDEMFKDSCFVVVVIAAAAVFLEQKSRNVIAAVLYVLKEVFIVFSPMTKL